MITSWLKAGRHLGPDGARRTVLVGAGGIALICTIQHLGRLRLTSLGLLARDGEPIPDVDHIREHGWLLAEQVAAVYRVYVPVHPILIATPFTRIRPVEAPIGFTTSARWRVSAALTTLPAVLSGADVSQVVARLRALQN